MILNSINNSSPSFGAKFVYTGFEPSFNPHDPYDDELDLSAVRRNQSERIKEIDSFRKFMKTEEGKRILDKLPENDVVELSAFVNRDRLYQPPRLEPILTVRHNDKPAFVMYDCALGKEEVEAYVNKAAQKIKEEDSVDSAMRGLLNPFEGE